MTALVDVDFDFPTADKVRETAEKRKVLNRDNGLRKIFEHSIDHAIIEGSTYCYIDRWELSEDIRNFLTAKGYTIEENDDPETGSSTTKIVWG